MGTGPFLLLAVLGFVLGLLAYFMLLEIVYWADLEEPPEQDPIHVGAVILGPVGSAIAVAIGRKRLRKTHEQDG